MSRISAEDQETLRKIFGEHLTSPVRIRYFGSKDASCQYCEEVQAILEEVAALSDKIDVKIYDYDQDAEEAARLNVDKVPATIFVDADEEDTGVHFYGIPAGYEFNTLIEDIIDMSTGKPDLPAEIVSKLEEIDSDVNLQVFITPT